MRKIVKSILPVLMISLSLLTACGQKIAPVSQAGEVSDNAEETETVEAVDEGEEKEITGSKIVPGERAYTADDVAEIVMTVDREEIYAGVGDIVTMDAVCYADDGTVIPDVPVEFCADGKTLEDRYFYPVSSGFNNLYVKYGEIRSNVIEIHTKKKKSGSDDGKEVIAEGDITFHGYSSSCPVIVIDASGKPISTKERKCTVRVYGEPGEGAQYGDEPVLVSAGEIKIRGQSSLGFLKKQYSLHLMNEDGTNNNVKLLGLPSENDWVLNGSYADKSLIRNGLAQTILGDVMEYTPRTQYCEVYLTTKSGTLDYIGLYTLVEKIKIDNKRVNIARLTPDDNEEPEITGGYIFSLDKVKGGENTLDTQVGTLTVVKPSPDEITEAQDNYIKTYLKNFTDTIKSDSKRNLEDGGAADYVDFESFAAPLAVTELLRNVDGFAISTYMHKDRGGKVQYGPGWDYDLSLGNADYNDGRNPEGWYVVRNSSLIRNIMRVDEMSELFVETWKELREGLLSDDNLDAYIDCQLSLAGWDCIARSCSRYPDHWNGAYVWPNYNTGDYFTKNHAEEIQMMRDFIHARAKWMDRHINELKNYPY